MENNLKLTVTQEKREETIDKILNLIQEEFKDLEVTAMFSKRLLEDAMKILETRAMLAPMNNITHKMNMKE